MKSYLTKFIYFLFTAGILTLLVQHYSKSFYSYEILAIKDYYGKLSENDDMEGHYFFVKMKFKKKWFQYDAQIYPKQLNLFDINDIKKAVATYSIKPKINVADTVFPHVNTAFWALPEDFPIKMKRISEIPPNDPECLSALNLIIGSPDEVGKKLGKNKLSETFDDTTDEALKVPFILNRDSEEMKVFVFRLDSPYDFSNNYSSRNPNYYYKLEGQNINTEMYQFQSYMISGLDASSEVPYLERTKQLLYSNKELARNCIEKAKSMKSGNPLIAVYDGILRIRSKEFIIGNELINDNFNNIPASNKEVTLVDIIRTYLIYGKSEDTERYIEEGVRLFPNSVYFLNLMGVQRILDEKYQAALDIYEKLSPRLTSDKHYSFLVNKALVLMIQKNYELADFYLLQVIDKSKKYSQRDIHIDDENVKLREKVFFYLGLNSFLRNNEQMSRFYFNQIVENEHLKDLSSIVDKGHKFHITWYRNLLLEFLIY